MNLPRNLVHTIIGIELAAMLATKLLNEHETPKMKMIYEVISDADVRTVIMVPNDLNNLYVPFYAYLCKQQGHIPENVKLLKSNYIYITKDLI